MGSIPSRNQVKSVRITQGSEAPTAAAWSGGENSKESENIAELERRLSECERRRGEAEERARAAESQSEILRQEVVRLHTQLSESPPCDSEATRSSEHWPTATVKVQEQLIKELESELAATKQDLSLMRERYERRLQRVRASSAKSQAESALAVFELRDVNSKLLEENTRLLEQVRAEKEALSHQASTSGRGEGQREDSGEQEAHTKLILELSQQVSSMDQELRHAHQTIQSLRNSRFSAGDRGRRRKGSATSQLAGSVGTLSLEDSRQSLYEEPTDEM